MSIYSIYRITNLVNGKVYIGKTKNSPQKRFLNHINDSVNKPPKTALHRAILKYGKESFRFEVIFNTFLEEDLDEFEMHFIKENCCCLLDGKDDGYNMTRGGDGGCTESSSREMKRRSAAGTHNFQGAESATRSRELRNKQLENGTHISCVKRVCPHCGTEGTGTPMYRYHFDHCKENPERPAARDEFERDVHQRRVESLSRFWVVTFPDGSNTKVKNLSKFCRENGLRSSTMCEVAKGVYSHHKGFKVTAA